MQNTEYTYFKSQLSKGTLPVVTGMHFTDTQIQEIKEALEKRKLSFIEYIDDYFDTCIRSHAINPIRVNSLVPDNLSSHLQIALNEFNKIADQLKEAGNRLIRISNAEQASPLEQSGL